MLKKICLQCYQEYLEQIHIELSVNHFETIKMASEEVWVLCTVYSEKELFKKSDMCMKSHCMHIPLKDPTSSNILGHRLLCLKAYVSLQKCLPLR